MRAPNPAHVILSGATEPKGLVCPNRSTFARGGSFAALRMTLCVIVATLACNSGDFDPVSKLTSVRVLATIADKPFAKPGDTVNVEALAVDARADRTLAMHVYWLPWVCNNPRADLYYACFAQLGSQLAQLGELKRKGLPLPPDTPPGLVCLGIAALGQTKDVTACLQEGSKFTIPVPANAVTSHPMVQGAPAPYGLSIGFYIACTGGVRLLPIDPANVSGQTLPLGCFDETGNQLGPDDYVFGFSRVYAYDDITNANPVIESVTFDGKPVVLSQGVVVPRCTSKTESDCEHAVNVEVPDSSWELVLGNSDSDTATRHEEIWAAYFHTIDKTKSPSRILFDPSSGRVDGSANRFIAPSVAGNGEVWIVVHDNRDGAAWTSFPVYVQ